jgi:hypothetical protein
MAKKLDPIISEFDTQEEADSYDAWFRRKVEQALNDPRPGIPHDEVMAQLRATIDAAAEAKKARGFEEESGAASDRLDPIVSEFETQEQADSYDRWFRQQVQAGIDDPRPRIPHDQVMSEMRAIIDAAIAKQKQRD